ncbi:uncharacterized protein LOC133493940 [Syngnathoides biaculeatus]|uniref:uncharacterized protein LOC133493940 n=1 Tax=Syngnathoides biaculeatus TaxID=300417 RepID=UPI002ADDB035|nr:uncharacterized protein LOC133493940 [Syngnathoides biaculeatus]
MEEGIKIKENGHCEMPTNRKWAEHRLRRLKRRFERDKHYHKDYGTFLVERSRKCCDHPVKCVPERQRSTKKFVDQKRRRIHNVNYWSLCSVCSLKLSYAEQKSVENLHSERQLSISCHIKEEKEDGEVQRIKEEEEEFPHIKVEDQDAIIQVPSTGVHSKSEDEGRSEERRGVEHSSRNSSSDGDHCEGSTSDGHDEQSDFTCHTANKSWKCSRCRKAFAFMRNLKRHMKRHTDITEALRIKWQEPDPLQIKEDIEEEEVHRIKEEEGPISIKKEEEEKRPHIKQENEEDTSKFPLTGLPMKSDDEGPSEESRGAEPPSSSLSQHMRRESDGDQNRGSHLSALLAPLSDHDDLRSESPDGDDDDEQCEEMVTCFAYGCYHRSGGEDCRFYRFPRKKQTLWARLCRRSDRQPTQPNDRLRSCHFKDGLMENDPVYFPHILEKWIDSADPGKRSQEESETFVHEMATNSQQLEDEHVQTADDHAHEDHTYASTACSSRCLEVKVLQKNVEDLMLECEKRKPMSLSDIKDREKKFHAGCPSCRNPLHLSGLWTGLQNTQSRKCCNRRVKMCARTTGEYTKKVCGPKREEEPQRQLRDAVFNLQPQIVQRRADVSEYLHPGWQQSVSGHIKEEEQGEWVQCIKEEEEEILHMKEEEQEVVIQVASTSVHLRSKDGQSEETQVAVPRCRNSSSDRECNREGSQTDGHNDDDDNDKQSEGDRKCHTANKCCKCSWCRKTFATMRNFKHMKKHTAEQPFSCSVCGQRFTQKGDLKRHTRTHTGEKRFSCTVCDQRFTQKGNLKIHTRTHTGEKPFSCSVCGQRFIQKGDLKRHTRTHTGEKPFSCSVCGQRFSRKGHLKVHTRTHSGEKPFSCSVCGQRFSRKETLKIHTRTHTGEKPFSCSECGQRFSVNKSLKRHTRTHISKLFAWSLWSNIKYSNPSFSLVNGDQNPP